MKSEGEEDFDGIHSFNWDGGYCGFPPPQKNAAVVIYGIKLAAGYLCADAFNKMLLSSESSRVYSQKGPFIAWSISIRERGTNAFQSELLVL